MAKFLNTSGTTYHLEELIKNASDRLIIISPYLKLNERIKELLEDRNRFKIDIRIVYGKNDLQPAEINWLKNLDFIRTSFCKNLHAKCYLNESQCIITSLNLYEFSQVNNNEMGVLIYRDEDTQLYTDTYEEAQRIIRISDEVRLSIETVKPDSIVSNEKVISKQRETSNEKASTTQLKSPNTTEKVIDNPTSATIVATTENANTSNSLTNKDAVSTVEPNYSKLTTAKLAKKLGIKTMHLNKKLVELGYLEQDGDKLLLTEAGKTAGGEVKKGKFGEFCVWRSDMVV